MNQYTALSERFNAQYTAIPIAGCWLWTGDTVENKAGDVRPRIKVNGKVKLAYRVAYEMLVGPIPDGMLVCHRCDVSTCVNPHHLFVGTHADNNRDCVSKGRNASALDPDGYRERARALGKSNNWSKGREGKSIIPHADIPAIRHRLTIESLALVAEDYGVSKQAVRQFIKRAAARVALAAAEA